MSLCGKIDFGLSSIRFSCFFVTSPFYDEVSFILLETKTHVLKINTAILEPYAPRLQMKNSTELPT